jgi:hypothetical protein
LLFADDHLRIWYAKMELYKAGFHQARKEVKELKKQRKLLREEVKRLKNIVRMHEEVFYHFDFE